MHWLSLIRLASWYPSHLQAAATDITDVKVNKAYGVDFVVGDGDIRNSKWPKCTAAFRDRAGTRGWRIKWLKHTEEVAVGPAFLT